MGKVGNFMQVLGSVAPYGSAVQLVGAILIKTDALRQSNMLKYYKDLASDAFSMAKIAEQIAREIVKSNLQITEKEGSIFSRIKDHFLEIMGDMSESDTMGLLNFIKNKAEDAVSSKVAEKYSAVKESKQQKDAMVVAKLISERVLSGKLNGERDKVGVLTKWVKDEFEDINNAIINENLLSAQQVLGQLKEKAEGKWKENKKIEKELIKKLANYIGKQGETDLDEISTNLHEVVKTQNQFLYCGQKISSLRRDFGELFSKLFPEIDWRNTESDITIEDIINLSLGSRVLAYDNKGLLGERQEYVRDTDS